MIMIGRTGVRGVQDGKREGYCCRRVECATRSERASSLRAVRGMRTEPPQRADKVCVCRLVVSEPFVTDGNDVYERAASIDGQRGRQSEPIAIRPVAGKMSEPLICDGDGLEKRAETGKEGRRSGEASR
jgi:hypothetical protein